MTWNYRIVCIDKGTSHEWYDIHEVYYNISETLVELLWTERAVAPGGETIDILKADIEMYLQAFEKPVIDIIEGKAVERDSVYSSASVERQ